MSTQPDQHRSPRPPMRGGGCLVAAGLIFGSIIGIFFQQTSLGMMVGFGIGAVAAVVLTIADRRR